MPHTQPAGFPLAMPLPPAQPFAGDASYPVEQFLSILDATWPLLALPADEPRLSAARIAYLAQFLRGRARLWFAEHLRQRHAAVQGAYTYAQLRAHLLQVFGSELPLPLPLRAPRRASTMDDAHADPDPDPDAAPAVQETGQRIGDRMRAEQAFARMVQRRGVAEYAHAYREASTQCGHRIDLDDEFECLWFAHGLRPAVRDEVLRVFLPGMRFDDVVQEAERAEKEGAA